MPVRRPDHHHYTERPPTRTPPPPRNSCVHNLALLGVLAVLLGLGYLFLLRPDQQAALPPGVLVPPTPTLLVLGAPPTPTLLPAPPPPGALTLTSAQANALLADNIAALRPIDAITVRFAPGQMYADVAVFDTQVQVAAGLVAEGGRIRVVDPRIDGPLSSFISIEDTVGPIEDQINAQIGAYDQQVREARLEHDQLIVVLEPR